MAKSLAYIIIIIAKYDVPVAGYAVFSMKHFFLTSVYI